MPDAEPPREFLLELKEDGTAVWLADAPAQKFALASSCLAKAQTSCRSLVDFDCEETECGLCACTLPASTLALEELTWSVAEHELSLVGDDFSASLQFCVRDDKLSYRADGAHALMVLERM